MKTEASEVTDDGIVTFLEAEVDAMVAREGRTNVPTLGEGIGNSQNGYRASPWLDSMAFSSDLPTFAQGRPSLPPSFPVSSGSQFQHFLLSAQYPTTGLPESGEWHGMEGPLGAIALANVAGNPPLAKHHRSMTPNLAPPVRQAFAQGSVSLWAGNAHPSNSRFHPYAPIAPSYQRAASLDPMTFLHRGSPFQRRLPNVRGFEHVDYYEEQGEKAGPSNGAQPQGHDGNQTAGASKDEQYQIIGKSDGRMPGVDEEWTENLAA